MTPKAAKKLSPLNIRMTEEMRAALEEVAREEKRSVSNLIVVVMEAFLKSREAQKKS